MSEHRCVCVYVCVHARTHTSCASRGPAFTHSCQHAEGHAIN